MDSNQVSHEDESDSEADFIRQCGYIRTIAESMLRQYFQDRCPDFEDHCVNCLRWKALDDLTENPWPRLEK